MAARKKTRKVASQARKARATAVEAVMRPPDTSFLQALALAMISVLFAYDGWTDSTYVAGEVVNPQRTMPIAIVWGTWLVIAVYVLTNVAFLHVLGSDGVARYEAALARLEGAEAAVAFSSGMAALTAVLLAAREGGRLRRRASQTPH